MKTTKDQKRQLLSLSLEEFTELLRKLITDLRLPKTDKPQDKVSDFIYLDEVMEITGYTQKTVYTKVSKNQMPVISRRRPLTFSRKELQEWMSSGRPVKSDIPYIRNCKAT
jgi:predicted DNA-binding transcriptional regulator AlpA